MRPCKRGHVWAQLQSAGPWSVSTKNRPPLPHRVVFTFNIYLFFSFIFIYLYVKIQHSTFLDIQQHTCPVWSRSDEWFLRNANHIQTEIPCFIGRCMYLRWVQGMNAEVSKPEKWGCSVVRWYGRRHFCIVWQTAAGWTHFSKCLFQALAA